MAQRMRTSRAQALYERGVHEMQCGQLRQAALTLQQVIFFAPDDARPVVALAECYVYLCDLQSALRHYRRALWLLTRQQDDDHDGDHTADGASGARRTHDDDDVVAVYGKSSSTSSTPHPHRCTMGQLQLLDTAVSPVLDVRVVRRRLCSLLDAIGLSLFRLSDFAQALRFASEALDVCDADGTADKDDDHDDDDDDASRRAVVALHCAVYLMALQREEEAERKLEAHMRRYPAHATETAALLVQLYCNRQAFRPARLLLERQDTHARNAACVTVARHLFHTTYTRYRAKALRERDLGTISKCIEVYGNDVDLLFTRAQLLIAAGQHKRSVRDLFRCIKETNGSHVAAVETMTSVLFTIGATLDSSDGIREAVSYYSESLKWRSDNTLVLRARGDCYVKLEDYASALQDYRRICNLDPDDRVAARRIACLHDLWGCKMHALGRIADAEREFSNAIRAADDEAVFYYHRALCRFALGERRYALRDVLSCQQLQPTHPTLRAFLVRFLGTSDAPAVRRGNHTSGSGSSSGGDVGSAAAVVVAGAISSQPLLPVWHDTQGMPHLLHDAATLSSSTRAAQRRAAAIYGNKSVTRPSPPPPPPPMEQQDAREPRRVDDDDDTDVVSTNLVRIRRRRETTMQQQLPSLLCGKRTALTQRPALARHTT